VKYQPTNPLDRPVLDPETFQQLLAAAYTLQEQNHGLPINKAKADFLPTRSDGTVAEKIQPIPPVAPTPEPLAGFRLPVTRVLPITHSDIEPSAPSHDSALQPQTGSAAPVPDFTPEIPPAATFKPRQSKPAQLRVPVHSPVPVVPSSSRHRTFRKRISPNNDLFWKSATVAAMAAVSALLLAAWIDQPSPLPAGLALPSEQLQQQVPFRKAASSGTAQPQSGRVSSRTLVMEPPATTNEPTAIDDLPRGTAAPFSAQKTIANANRHSTYESEAGIVAPDTIVRYGPRSAAPRVQVQSKP